jgi:hypothetical protein
MFGTLVCSIVEIRYRGEVGRNWPAELVFEIVRAEDVADVPESYPTECRRMLRKRKGNRPSRDGGLDAAHCYIHHDWEPWKDLGRVSSSSQSITSTE